MISTPLMQDTAARIKVLRAARALTQEDLAALAGRSVASVQRIERGEKVGADTIASIAAAFDMTAEGSVKPNALAGNQGRVEQVHASSVQAS